LSAKVKTTASFWDLEFWDLEESGLGTGLEESGLGRGLEESGLGTIAETL
jgi:hypothetical protein